jgi:hypothetical protein
LEFGGNSLEICFFHSTYVLQKKKFASHFAKKTTVVVEQAWKEKERGTRGKRGKRGK